MRYNKHMEDKYRETLNSTNDDTSNNKATTKLPDDILHAKKLSAKKVLADLNRRKTKFLSKKELLLKKKYSSGSKLRDPLFAAKILEQEKSVIHKPAQIRQTPSSRPLRSEVSENKPRILRTYKDDVAKALENGKTSMAQMVLAEQRKKEQVQEKKTATSKENMPFFVSSIFLGFIGLLILTGAVFYFLTTEDGVDKKQQINLSTIIFTEEIREIDITDTSKKSLTKKISDEIKNIDITLDFIENIYFTKQIPLTAIDSLEEQQYIKTLVSAEQFLRKIEAGASDTLLRSLSDEFVFGVHVFNGNQPFMILKTDFFENSFTGLLKWEKSMAKDLLPLFAVAEYKDDIVNKKFKDIIIKNRDIRALIDENNEIALLYSFFDKNTIIISTAEETLDEVISRLNRPTSTRIK